MQPRTIEEKILANLEPLTTRCRAVDYFEGTQSALGDWLATVEMPAVLIWYSGRQPQTIAEDALVRRIEARFTIWFINDRLRGYVAGMQEPNGLYDLMETAEGILAGNHLGLAIQKLALESELPVMIDQDTGRMIWEQVWVTDYITA